MLIILLSCVISFPSSSIAEFTLHYWSIYSQNNNSIVGIFTSLGAIFTVCVFYTTYKSTKNAEKNTKLAIKNIKISEENLQQSFVIYRKDDFIKQFILLLELHNISLNVMIKNIKNSNTKIDWRKSGTDSAEDLYQKYQFSPYMRMLYRVLKHIYYDFYRERKVDEDIHKYIDEQKKYSSIVRSTITNDVLFFVAINSMNKRGSFEKYRKMLKDFDFFKHIITDEINEEIKFDINTYSESISKIDSSHTKNILYEALNSLTNSLELKIKNNSNLNFKLDLPVTLMIELMKNYSEEQFQKFLLKIEDKVNLSNTQYHINDYIEKTEIKNTQFYFFKVKDKSETIYKDFFSNDYEKLPTPALRYSDLENDIKIDDLSLEYFKKHLNIKDDSILFSSEDYSANSWGTFLDVECIYRNFITYLKHKIAHKENKKGRLIKKMNMIIVDAINNTELIKSNIAGITVREDNKIKFTIMK